MIVCRTAVLWGVAAWMGATALAAETSTDARLVDGLRQRQLFELAEAWCRQRLQQPDLPDQARVELVIELSRTLVEWARNAAPAEAAPLWRRAADETETLARQQPTAAGLLLLQVQNGLVHLAQGESLRQQAELLGSDDARFAPARDALRRAIQQLTDAADRIELHARSMPRGAVDAQGWTLDRWLTLARNTRYQLARALRNQGETYPQGSADRVNACQQSIELLQPLTVLEGNDPLVWWSRVDLVRGYRLLDELSEAGRRLEAFQQQEPPATAHGQLLAESLRLAMARGDWQQVRQLIETPPAAEAPDSAEWDLARVEALAALWRQASEQGDTESAAALQQQAAAFVHRLEARHGAYWARRAEGQLASSVVTQAGAADHDLLLRAAESLYRTGQIDDALAAYDRLASEALAAGTRELAFEAAYRAAAIEHQRNAASATERLLQLARALADHPRAAEAHLAALHLLAQAARQGDTAALDQYGAGLTEHLTCWPAAASADSVRLWMAQWARHRGQFDEALSALQAIAPDSPRFDEALEQLADTYRAAIAARRESEASPQTLALEAAGRMAQVVVGPRNQWPEPWTTTHRRAALWAARFLIEDAHSGYEQAARLLEAAVTAPGELDPHWVQQARGWWSVALASEGHAAEAAALWNQAQSASPAELLPMIEALARAADQAAEPRRGDLRALLVRHTGSLWPRRELLASAPQQALALLHARALLDTDQTETASQLLAPLAAAAPSDGAIQEMYATALAAGSSDAARRAALAQWRLVEQRSRPGTPRWFRAKLAVATLHHQLGDSQQALRIVQLTAALHPELGGESLREQFESLRKVCQQAAGNSLPPQNQ